jgi:DNA (cytosine-5)-methyltransferase 1
MALVEGVWWDGSNTASTIDSTSNDHRMPDKGRFTAVIQPLPLHVPLAVRTAQTGANGIGVAEDVEYTLDGAQGQAIAFSAKDYGGDAGPLSPTLRSGTHDRSHANGGVMPAVAFTASEQSNGFAWERPHYPTLTAGAPTDSSNIQHGIRIGTVVRRLTPRECERLQGLPDDWTLVPYRGKPAADAPRYKAIGNGMAMPVLRWIGQRIAMVEGQMNA